MPASAMAMLTRANIRAFSASVLPSWTATVRAIWLYSRGGVPSPGPPVVAPVDADLGLLGGPLGRRGDPVAAEALDLVVGLLVVPRAQEGGDVGAVRADALGAEVAGGELLGAPDGERVDVAGVGAVEALAGVQRVDVVEAGLAVGHVGRVLDVVEGVAAVVGAGVEDGVGDEGADGAAAVLAAAVGDALQRLGQRRVEGGALAGVQGRRGCRGRPGRRRRRCRRWRRWAR